MSIRVSVLVTASSNAHKWAMNLKSFPSVFVNLSKKWVLLYICAGWMISLLKLCLKLQGLPTCREQSKLDITIMFKVHIYKLCDDTK